MKSNFLSSFFTSIDAESCNEEYEVVNFPNVNELTNAIKSGELVNSTGFIHGVNNEAIPQHINSFLDSSMVQLIEMNDYTNEKSNFKKNSEFNEEFLKTTNNSFYYNSDHLFTDNNLLKYLPKNETQDLTSNLITENTTKNNNNNNSNNNLEEKKSDISKKNKTKKSTPNLTFHDKRDFSQFSQFSTPYLTKGKLCGHFKVRIWFIFLSVFFNVNLLDCLINCVCFLIFGLFLATNT